MLPVSSDSAASMVMREATLLQPATTHAVPKDERRAVQADTPGVELTQPLQPAFRGPGCAAGLDLGGRGPESIALSIIAEVQRELHGD